MSEEQTCPTCGSPVKVVGRTTKHYELDLTRVEGLDHLEAALREADELARAAQSDFSDPEFGDRLDERSIAYLRARAASASHKEGT